MIAASKKSILELIPEQYLPKTILIPTPKSYRSIEFEMIKQELSYPVIFKPDLGERGWKVEKINNQQEGEGYLQNFKADLQIQEYLDLPYEAGVFYYRFPDEADGTISSIVIKELLFVLGDGTSTLEQLILKKPRARLHYNTLKLKWETKWNMIPECGKRIELQPIGNHNRGTAFLNGNHLINDELIQSFNAISKQIDGFYYGRYDVRCKDEEALKQGKIMIMELNGAASEPAHIYQQGYPIIKAYKTLFHHWKVLYKISVANHKKGTPYTPFKQGWHDLTHSGRIAEQGI